MGLEKTVRILLLERRMTMTDLANKFGTSVQNMSAKFRKNNFTEKELNEIAKACNATFEGAFILNDTGKIIK